jgi:hypothetical protein
MKLSNIFLISFFINFGLITSIISTPILGRGFFDVVMIQQSISTLDVIALVLLPSTLVIVFCSLLDALLQTSTRSIKMSEFSAQHRILEREFSRILLGNLFLGWLDFKFLMVAILLSGIGIAIFWRLDRVARFPRKLSALFSNEPPQSFIQCWIKTIVELLSCAFFTLPLLYFGTGKILDQSVAMSIGTIGLVIAWNINITILLSLLRLAKSWSRA